MNLPLQKHKICLKFLLKTDTCVDLLFSTSKNTDISQRVIF